MYTIQRNRPNKKNTPSIVPLNTGGGGVGAICVCLGAGQGYLWELCRGCAT